MAQSGIYSLLVVSIMVVMLTGSVDGSDECSKEEAACQTMMINSLTAPADGRLNVGLMHEFCREIANASDCWEAMPSDCKKASELTFEKIKRSADVMCAKKNMDVLDRHAACFESMNRNITIQCQITALTDGILAAGDIGKACQVVKDYISCKRMAVAGDCGDEAARYLSDFVAHEFQISMDYTGDYCDMTAGKSRVGCSALVFVGATLILPALGLLGL